MQPEPQSASSVCLFYVCFSICFGCLTFNENTFFLFILLTVHEIFPAAICFSDISFTLSFNSLPIKENKLNSNLDTVIKVCACMCLYESVCVCVYVFDSVYVYVCECTYEYV